MKQVMRLTPEFILVCYILLFLSFKHPGESWDRSINSDGKGYYAYLPALFIYHDLTYKFVESYELNYYPIDRSVFKEFRIQKNGKIVNKTFPGLAILWLPFFLIAHLLSLISGFPADGYSILYQFAISIAALFYLWLGCRFLIKLLVNSGASVQTAAFITVIIALGTNIMYFAVVENSMSHVYSFCLITLFLYYVYRYFKDTRSRCFFFICSLLFGLIILVRPTNALIILLVPLMAWIANPEVNNPILVLLSKLFNSQNRIYSLRHLLPGILILLFLFSLPLVLWHHTTGHWFVYQYGEERFHFLHPHFFGILFSYNRGWLTYTPIAFISLFGFYQIWKENKPAFYWTLFFLFLFVYISSCWWMWYYASKCGQRIFIDLYAFVAILLLFLFTSVQTHKIIRYLLNVTLVLLTGLNIFQCYQHSCFIFPATDINSIIYWDSFPRLHPAAKVFFPQEAIIARKSFFTDMEKPQGWENLWTLRKPFGFSGKYSSLITKKHPYSVGRYETLNPLFISPNRIILVKAMVWSLGKTSGSTLVVEVNSGDKRLSYNSFYLAKYVQADQWTPIEAAFYVPRDIPENSIAKIYFYNNIGSVPLFIDDMSVEFISLKDEKQYTWIEGFQFPVK
jgi:hypothetical protein